MTGNIAGDLQSGLTPATLERYEVESSNIHPIDVWRILLVLLAAAAVWLHVWEPLPHFSIIGIAAALIGGYPIFKEAVENIFDRRMTMELSMTIALVAALSIGQVFTALVITGFVLVAEVLEHLTVSRGREAIGDLLRYLPQSALVRRNGAIDEIPANQLVPGDTVLVNPGALVAVDGTVLGGHSFVDEARITGESTPAEKSRGARVYAGTVNQNGALEVRTERVGRDTSFGQIINAVESAERSRAPIERIADQLSGYLVYFALGAAIITFLITRNIVSTISVIIVAGACGVAAGTPLAVLGAIGRAASGGAIVKGGRYLEALAATDVVIFDKTGAITYGRPEVQAVFPVAGCSEATLLAIAAIAELRSEHPLGRAIIRQAELRAIPLAEPNTFSYRPGRGILATFQEAPILVGNAQFLKDEGYDISSYIAPEEGGTSDVLVASSGKLLGFIRIADTIRPEAPAAVADLRQLSIRTVLLTGDVRGAAESVAQQVGIDNVAAELLPEQKSSYVASLVDEGKIVVMVGDGVNDAPALVRATVGVAMGSGTDVARESADIVLIGNDLSRFVATLRTARRTKAIIMQNFVGTIAVDSVGILLAAFGLLNPLLAAFVHVASELAFILNSSRMLTSRMLTSRGERNET